MIEHPDVRLLLPHRHPMLLVDRVLTCEPSRIVTSKAISGSEPCYQGLTDDLPTQSYRFPSVLILESFAQSGALLWALENRTVKARGVLALGGIRKVRFYRSVYPGDVIQHTVQIEKMIGDNALLSGQVDCGGRLIATVGSLIAVVRPPADM